MRNSNSENTAGFSFLMIVLAIVSFVTWGGVRAYKHHVTFTQECGGHLERAAHANTIPLAKKEIDIVLKYAEDNGLTKGYTSVVYNTPDEDVEFWYQNLVAAQKELAGLEEKQVTAMEQSNVLLKLRESLRTNSGGSSDNIIPDGISIYPNNTAYFWWCTITVLWGVVWGLVFGRYSSR